MRRTSIETGKLFAYRTRKWDTWRPLVFLSRDLVIRAKPDDTDELFTPVTAASRAPVNHGYAAIAGPPRASEEVLEQMRGLSLDNVRTWPLPSLPAGLPFTCFLLTRMATVGGPYEEILAEEKRRADREEGARQARDERIRAQLARRQDLARRLDACGVVTRPGVQLHEDWLRISLDEAERLAKRLEG